MIILKVRKGKGKYKEKCPCCRTKLLLYFEDIEVEKGCCGGEYATYHCPVCQKRQYLAEKNKKNYFSSKWYLELLKQEVKQ